jgi:hypothetical protein
MAAQQQPNKNWNQTKGIAALIRGSIYLVVAFFVIDFQRKGKIDVGDTFSYIAAGLMVAYGLYRVYRAIRIFQGKD